jgi:hypothetical protein
MSKLDLVSFSLAAASVTYVPRIANAAEQLLFRQFVA